MGRTAAYLATGAILLGITLGALVGCAARRVKPTYPTPDAAFQAGEQLFAAGNCKSAVGAYNDVLLAGPNALCPKALYQVAVCFIRLGDRIDAEIVFRKLIAQYPTAPEAARAREALTGVQIVVTSGSLSQPYQVLGPVHFDTVGSVNVGSVVVDALTRSRLAADIQATPKARCDQLNEMLKAQGFNCTGTESTQSSTSPVELTRAVMCSQTAWQLCSLLQLRLPFHRSARESRD